MILFSNPFGGPLHVVCPSCHGQAVFDGGDLTCMVCAFRSNWTKHCDPELALPVRCSSCGASSRPKRYAYRPRCDKCGAQLGKRVSVTRHDARLAPWAEVETRHGSVWAANPAHLAAMQSYVAGPRQHPVDPAKGTRRLNNRDWRSRLPQWMKLAKNRSEVLKALRKLEKRFAEVA